MVDTEDGQDDGDMDDRVVRKLRRDLASKDRMIENLEQQLRTATQSEIHKWKRGTNIIIRQEMWYVNYTTHLYRCLHMH